MRVGAETRGAGVDFALVLVAEVDLGAGRERGMGSGEGSGVRLPLEGDGRGDDFRRFLLGYASAADSEVLEDEDG